jgi:hypothetical protein
MRRLFCATAVAAGIASAAGAAPISVTFFDGSALGNKDSQFYADYKDIVSGSGWIVEDFETRDTFTGFFEEADGLGGSQAGAPIAPGGEGEIFGTVDTGTVGTFTGIGGIGTGSTCEDLDRDGLDCDNIAIQDPEEVNGQGNIVPFGGSGSINIADTEGFLWTVRPGKLFKSVVFALRDAVDQRNSSLTITAKDGNSLFVDDFLQAGRLGNDNLMLVKISFDTLQSEAFITVRTRTNDSLNIDGAAVNVVPLPAGMWMLLAGLGGFLALKRRKTA